MGDMNLADAWETIVDTVPGRLAVTVGDTSRTFAEVDARANQLAHVLLERGVQPGQHVGVQLYNGFEYLEAMFACWKIRAVPINVNYRYVADELRYLFTDADLVGLVVDEQFLDRVAPVAPEVPTLRWQIVVGPNGDYEDVLAGGSPARDFAPRSGDDHYVIYTGGTTGMPKGVVWRMDDAFYACFAGGDPTRTQGEVSTMEQLRERVFPDAMTFLPLAPLMHAAGTWTVVLYLFTGSRIVLMPGALDPEAVWRAIEREKVGGITVVADAMLRPLLDAYDTMDPKPDHSSLYMVATGGGPISPAMRDRFLATFPEKILRDGYGSSETGIQAGRTFSAADKDARFVATDTVVLDESTRLPVEPGSGTVGRVARPGRMPIAYYKDPEKTAATFVEWDGQRWALTGDMATVEADGTVTVLGRGSLCINTGGEKVYAEEVEAVLRSHDGVYDVLVAGAPDDRWGERVVAIVQPSPGASPSADELREHCRSSLAGYKVPKDVVFVETVVRSPAGKGDYRWAQAQALKGR